LLADKINRYQPITMNAYYEQMILGASPIELTRLLYQRAIALVRNAREHLNNGKVKERSDCISKAWEILLEFITALRPEEAPELCARLRALYCYMQGRLLQANLEQSDEPLADVLGLLTTLADAWAPIEASEPARNVRSPLATGHQGQPHSAHLAFSA